MTFTVVLIACKIPFIFITQTSYNGAVAGQLEQNSYPGKILSRFYIFQINIYNLHLIHKENCPNKLAYMFQM